MAPKGEVKGGPKGILERGKEVWRDPKITAPLKQMRYVSVFYELIFLV